MPPKASPKRTRKTTKASTAASPSKKSPGKAKATAPPKTLESFFKNPPPPPPPRRTVAQNPPEQPQDDFVDDIEDDDFAEVAATASQATLVTDRKRSWSVANGGQPAPAPAAKFLKPAKNGSLEAAHTTQKPWTEQYTPRDLGELAVHPKKVSDVRKWFEGVYNGQIYQRLLVLRGSAGTGKTLTVALLAKELNCDVVEWSNPEAGDGNPGRYVSTSAMFADFMSRASIYSGLELVSSGSGRETPSTGAASTNKDRQMLLIEEFPSTSGSSTSLNSFRSQLLQYLSANVSSKTGPSNVTPIPVVLVISESILSSTNPSDNFTAHRLLGRDLLSHPGVTVIDFNPVAQTLLAKALKLVVQKHTQAVGRAQNVTADIVKALSEVGDMRNAVSTLEYLSKDPGLASAAAPVKSRGKTKSRTKQADSDPKTDIASKVALREGTIGLFHAIGKVVYNKRGVDKPIDTANKPPPDLDIDALLSSAGTDNATFLSALHENYALSCYDQYGDSEATLDSMNGCLEAASSADILSSSGATSGIVSASQRVRARPFTSGTSEGLRQDEVALYVGVLGMQNALPYPVKRQSGAPSDDVKGAQRGRTDHFRMYYPTELKLWRQREDLQASLDLLTDRLLSGALDAHMPSVRFKRSSGSVASQAEDAPASDGSGVEDADRYNVTSSGQSARQMLLLERLPYMKHIFARQGGRASVGAGLIGKAMDEVVRFKGVSAGQDDESDDEDAAVDPQKNVGAPPAEDVPDEMEKLMLDDDPIDDDD